MQNAHSEGLKRVSLATLTIKQLSLLLLICWSAVARLLEVGPITDQTLMLWFREGKYNHIIDMDARYPCCSSVNVAWEDIIDTAKIHAASSYTLTSGDDPDFGSGVKPSTVGLKCKASDCKKGGSADHFKDHWVFLVLPSKLKRGKTYTLSMGTIGSDQTFTYDEFAQRCEAIHVNHYGYPPQSTTKYAYISQFMGDLGGLELEDHAGAQFHVVKDGESTPLFTGTINKRKDYETGGWDSWNFRINNTLKSYTMADVWQCDFTAYQGEPGYDGAYRVVVEGMGCSYPFRIDSKVYFDAWKDAMNGLFDFRCGIDCHKNLTYKETDATDVEGSSGTLTGATMTINGGYHDAADCDKLTNHTTVANHLLWAFETRPEIFTDGELDIPEAGNGVPDLLDEAAWQIAFGLRLQKDDGSVRVGTSVTGCSSPDHGENLVFSPTASHTLRFSCLANHLAHCMKMVNVNEITGPYYEDVDLTRTNLRAKAKAAYDWGVAHFDSTARKAATELYAAHAWMYKVTGDKPYEDAFKQDNPIQSPSDSLYPMVDAPADGSGPGTILYDMQEPAWIYLTTDHPGMDQAYKQVYRGAFDLWYTHDRIQSSATRGMRQAHHWRKPTVVGVQTTPDIYPQAIAYFKIFGEKRWLDVCYPSLDWVLGGNQMNYCWMYETGHRSPYEYHYHGTPPKGLVIYGHAFVSMVSRVNTNSGNTNFNVTTMYPMFRNWGQMELYCENRIPCLTSEFTVHQTQAGMCASLAMFKDGGPTDVSVNGPPRHEYSAAAAVPSPPLVTWQPHRLELAFVDEGAGRRKVDLVSISGRCVLSLATTGKAVSVPLAGIANGHYLLRVTRQRRVVSSHPVSVMR